MLTGCYMASIAERWVAENPDAWERITALALGYERSNRRFSMERLLQTARYDMATNGHIQGFKVNNNARAALARKLIAQHPEVKRCMDIRRSAVDDAEL